MREKKFHVEILFTIGVVDPGEKPNKRQSNPESSRPGDDDKLLDAPLLLHNVDIGSVDKVDDIFNNSATHVERHTSKGNEGLL